MTDGCPAAQPARTFFLAASPRFFSSAAAWGERHGSVSGRSRQCVARLRAHLVGVVLPLGALLVHLLVKLSLGLRLGARLALLRAQGQEHIASARTVSGVPSKNAPRTYLDGGGGLFGRLVQAGLAVLGQQRSAVARLDRRRQLLARALAVRLRLLGAAGRLGALRLLRAQRLLRLLARRRQRLRSRNAVSARRMHRHVALPCAPPWRQWLQPLPFRAPPSPSSGPPAAPPPACSSPPAPPGSASVQHAMKQRKGRTRELFKSSTCSSRPPTRPAAAPSVRSFSCSSVTAWSSSSRSACRRSSLPAASLSACTALAAASSRAAVAAASAAACSPAAASALAVSSPRSADRDASCCSAAALASADALADASASSAVARCSSCSFACSFAVSAAECSRAAGRARVK